MVWLLSNWECGRWHHCSTNNSLHGRRTFPPHWCLDPRLRCRAGLPQSSHGPVGMRLMLVGLSHWTLRWFVMKYYGNRWLIPIVREVSLRGWYLSWDLNEKKPVLWWSFQAKRTSNMRKKMQRWEQAWHVQGTERRPVRLDDVRGWVGEGCEMRLKGNQVKASISGGFENSNKEFAFHSKYSGKPQEDLSNVVTWSHWFLKDHSDCCMGKRLNEGHAYCSAIPGCALRIFPNTEFPNYLTELKSICQLTFRWWQTPR